jgi:tetrahydromethanopterin S-methyltransferase subunit G
VELTKRQKNEIYEALTANGVDPSECTGPLRSFGGIKGDIEIEHRRSGSKIYAWPDGKDHLYRGKRSLPGVANSQFVRCDWSQLITQIEEWAKEVKYESDTPDFWEELKKSERLLAAVQAEESSNALFTADEQAEVARQIEGIKRQIRTSYELPAEQLAAIEQKLDEVREASQRVGRKDWVLILYGAAVGMFVNDSVPSHVVQGVLAMAVHGVAHIFGLGGLPPAIPSQA